MIHNQISVFFCLKSHLWANISSINSWKALPVLISDSYDKWVYSKFFTFHNQLSKDQCIVWNQSKLSRPVLCSSDAWSVKLNFTSLFDESGCSLKWLYIRSMSELGLSITSNLFIHPSGLNILFLLFLCSHNFNTFDKHGQMYRSRSLLNRKIQRINNIGLFVKVFTI